MNNKKILVIGLDGVSWNVLNPLIEMGLMPNLKKLKNEGVHGDLKSSNPPVTYPAWKCYSTGKDPSQLGVYWWMNVDIRNRKIKINNSSSFKGKDIWDYLGEIGKRTIVINMPCTYPAKKINGIMISGPPSPNIEESVYPKELVSYLQEKNYKNFPEAKWIVNKDIILDEVEYIHRKQKEIALDIMESEKWDFFHFTFFLTDPILHHFWKYKDNKYEQGWTKFWKEIDEFIGEFIKKIPKECLIFLISDHGMTELKAQIFLNRYLFEKGYLSLSFQSSSSRLLNMLPTHFIANSLSKIGIIDVTFSILTKFNLIKFLHTGAETGINNDSIDWNKTKAFCLSDMDGLIYLNNKLNKEKLIKELLSIQDPKSGNSVFKDVISSENIYINKNNLSPQINVIPREGYRISPSISSKKVFDYSQFPWSGTHREKGFFIAFGKDIKEKERIDCSIYDLAPTILHIFNHKIPLSMKGNVLKEIFKPDFELASKEVEYEPRERDNIKTVLHSLKRKGEI
jgi:predicted AlkP superfamily phosphohydrolase/phosphomutase